MVFGTINIGSNPIEVATFPFGVMVAQMALTQRVWVQILQGGQLIVKYEKEIMEIKEKVSN